MANINMYPLMCGPAYGGILPFNTPGYTSFNIIDVVFWSYLINCSTMYPSLLLTSKDDVDTPTIRGSIGEDQGRDSKMSMVWSTLSGMNQFKQPSYSSPIGA
jgi:hypothetical protein